MTNFVPFSVEVCLERIKIATEILQEVKDELQDKTCYRTKDYQEYLEREVQAGEREIEYWKRQLEHAYAHYGKREGV